MAINSEVDLAVASLNCFDSANRHQSAGPKRFNAAWSVLSCHAMLLEPRQHPASAVETQLLNAHDNARTEPICLSYHDTFRTSPAPHRAMLGCAACLRDIASESRETRCSAEHLGRCSRLGEVFAPPPILRPSSGWIRIYAQEPHADSEANVSASTRVPRAMSSAEANSSGRWLYPPRHGMKSIATGAIRAMNRLS